MRHLVGLAKAAERLQICIGSARKLIDQGRLPASQAMPGATWLVPAAALQSEAVLLGAREIVARRPKVYQRYQDDKLLRLPGI